MNKLVILLVPPVVGGIFGMLGMFGLVASQTSAPDKNPASQAALVYGE
jgi:hypothetical protein